MKRVIVVVEGATEGRFVADLLAPELLARANVLVTARILGVPGHKGGRVNYPRLQKDLLILLRSDRDAFCTTLLDYYGLAPGFPGDTGAPGAERAASIEAGMKLDVVGKAASVGTEQRFIPYLQLHEFEGLLFSDPEALADAIHAPSLAATFAAIRNQFPTPEDINDDFVTAPSKRILKHHPDYNKVLDGTRAAHRITIEKMRQECPRFQRWITALEALPDTVGF